MLERRGSPDFRTAKSAQRTVTSIKGSKRTRFFFNVSGNKTTCCEICYGQITSPVVLRLLWVFLFHMETLTVNYIKMDSVHNTKDIMYTQLNYS